jgi:hypothetical protein
VKDTGKRPAAEQHEPGADLRPSRYRDDDEILDKFNVLISADAAQAIELLGHKARMKTTRWAFERGLERWQQVREVIDFLAARRTLNAAGSAEVHRFNHWTPVLTDAKTYSMYGVTKRQAKRCADLGSALGVGTQRMAGLCIDAGIFDALTVPVPTNHRVARALGHVRSDLRDRLRQIERLCDGESADPPRIITWAEVCGERKPARKTDSPEHPGGRVSGGKRALST